LWQPNSLDLNPVDYKVWSAIVMQEQVYKENASDMKDAAAAPGIFILEAI